MAAVIILGRGDDWSEYQYRPGQEIWGTLTGLLQPGLRDLPFSKLFGFDGLNFPEIAAAVPIAKSRNIPIVSTLDYATELYPIRDVVKRFRSSFFMNSIPYMIAYALYLKYDKISLFGIGGRIRWDYEKGKNYILFWLGVATGLGVDCHVGRGASKWLYSFDKQPFPAISPEEILSWHEVEKEVVQCV